MKEVTAELDHERRNGEKAQPLEQDPGGVMEELVEEDEPVPQDDDEAVFIAPLETEERKGKLAGKKKNGDETDTFGPDFLAGIDINDHIGLY